MKINLLSKWIVLMAALGLMIQCRTVTLSDLRAFHSPDSLQLDVEFEKYPDMDCGPYAVYTLTQYYYPFKEIAPEPYLDYDMVWAYELVASLRQAGLKAELLQGNLTLLREHLMNEDIPIVFIRRSRFRRYGHYVLFTGYDFEKGRVWLADEEKDMELPLYTFLRAWERGNKYLISVTLPE